MIFFCSSIISITGSLEVGSISVEWAFLIPKIFLANSITAICIPRQIPKNGNPFSLAYFTAVIFPSIPRWPKPGATNKPSRPASLSPTLSSVMNSEWIYCTCTLHSLIAPAWTKDSRIDLYASCNSTYLPINPIVTFDWGFFNLFKNSFHFPNSGSLLLSISSFFMTISSSFSSIMINGTS